jgi:hypothetical protein
MFIKVKTKTKTITLKLAHCSPPVARELENDDCKEIKNLQK